MPANVESAVYANTPAWHGEGVVLDTEGKLGLTVEQALELSDLDWDVKLVPIYAQAVGGRKMEKIDGRMGVQRQTDGRVFGTVGGTWRPMQNRDGFSVLQTLLEQAGGEVWIESAGALDGGKKVWMLARCADALQIAGESYKSYIGFTNGHDGRTSVTAFMCDERVVCANTLTYALSKQDAGERIVRVRHTTKAEQKIAEAHHVLGLRNARNEQLAVQGEWLVDQPMSDSAFEIFIETLMPLPAEDTTSTGGPTPAVTMITKRREQVIDLFMSAPNLQPIRGTKWAALQAVTEYVDHGRPTKNTSALAATQFGLTPSVLKQKAFELLVPKK